MRAVHAGIQHRHGRTPAAIACIPGACRIDGGMSPLQVEEAVIVVGYRRIDIERRHILRRDRQVELDHRIGHRGPHGGNPGGARHEACTVRFHDGHADLRQARDDAAAGSLDLVGKLCIETVGMGGDDVGGGLGPTAECNEAEGDADRPGEYLHGILLDCG